MDHLTDCSPALCKIFNVKQRPEHPVFIPRALRKLKRGNDGIRKSDMMPFTAFHKIMRRASDEILMANGVFPQLIRRNIFFWRGTRFGYAGRMREDSDTHGRVWKSK